MSGRIAKMSAYISTSSYVNEYGSEPMGFGNWWIEFKRDDQPESFQFSGRWSECKVAFDKFCKKTEARIFAAKLAL